MLDLSSVLIGGAQALAVPPSADCAGDYSAGMAGVVALLCVLGAEEAEGAAARLCAENRDMRALFADAASEGHAGDLAARLSALASEQDTDLRLSALDAAGGRLREALIALHLHAEVTGNAGLEHAILRLLQRQAAGRRLRMPRQ